MFIILKMDYIPTSEDSREEMGKGSTSGEDTYIQRNRHTERAGIEWTEVFDGDAETLLPRLTERRGFCTHESRG